MIGETIGHYHILEELGRGGMGVVYKAEDERLKRTVAIKFLPQHRGHTEDDKKRFKREAQAAAALNHPNIATIYAIEEIDDQIFIAMEFIEGQTLKEATPRYRDDYAKTVDIALQIAEGLQAAHENGVIHRDVKSANIMLTERGQVKIMDFGLAKVSHSTILTQSGTTLGTMAYMSPEQIRGETVDQRSDVWSFGVVLFEMLCDELPFRGDMDPAIMYSILNEPPAPVLAEDEKTPDEIKKVVFSALEKDPKKRLSTIEDVKSELLQISAASNEDGATSNNSSPAHVAQSRIGLGGKLALAATGVVAAILALWLLLLKNEVPDPSGRMTLTRGSMHDSESRQSIAVLGFKNVSGREEVAWLSTAFSEMLTTELAAGEVLRTIPGESVSQMKLELALQEAESFGNETLEKIRKNLGTDMVVSGSFIVAGDADGAKIRIDIRVQDAVVGETLLQLAETGPETELFDLVSRTGTQLRRRLGIEELSAQNRFAVLASLPANTEAVRFYAKGLEKMRRFEAVAAKDFFEQAVASDPDFALAQTELARAWRQMGYDKNAQAAIEKALENAEGLPQEERKVIEAQHHEMNGERAEAAEIYKGLWNDFTDQAEYGLRLADLQSTIGEQEQALDAINTLRGLPDPISSDARIDIMEARISERMNNYAREQEVCAAARLKATEQGALLLVAESWFYEGRSQYFQNAPQKALASFDEAKRIYEQTNYRTQVATLLNAIAIVERNRGNHELALENYNKALKIKRDIGEKGGEAGVLNGLGIVYRNLGDAQKSAETLRESLQIQRELGNWMSVPGVMINLADALARLGQADSARTTYEGAISAAANVNNKYIRAVALNNYSALLNDLGSLDEALNKRKAALRLFREIGHNFMISFALFGYGEILKDQDDLIGAKAKHDSSLAIREELKMGEVVNSRIAIASVLIEMGKSEDAEKLLTGSLAKYRAKMTAPMRAQTLAALSLAQALQRKTTVAKNNADSAASLIGNVTDKKDRLDVELFIAESLLEQNVEYAYLREAIEKLLAEANDLDYAAQSFKARLLSVQFSLKLSEGVGTRERASLEQLSSDASAQGFNLIVRKADELLQSYRSSSARP